MEHQDLYGNWGWGEGVEIRLQIKTDLDFSCPPCSSPASATPREVYCHQAVKLTSPEWPTTSDLPRQSIASLAQNRISSMTMFVPFLLLFSDLQPGQLLCATRKQASKSSNSRFGHWKGIWPVGPSSLHEWVQADWGGNQALLPATQEITNSHRHPLDSSRPIYVLYLIPFFIRSFIHWCMFNGDFCTLSRHELMS